MALDIQYSISVVGQVFCEQDETSDAIIFELPSKGTCEVAEYRSKRVSMLVTY